jgi:hypothetical protein
MLNMRFEEYAKAIKTIMVKLFPWTMEAFDKYKFVMTNVEAP